ncbi:MAG: ABC transporter permease [Chloroflexi bacterium]|nr:ABC transporter permease [Chloroflexota bacterium]
MIYVFAMLFIITVFTGSGYLMQSVIEEKETRVIEVLITSVRASQLLAGKVLAQAVMALVQVSVWIGMGLILLVLQGDFLRQSLPFLVGIIIPVSALPILLVYFILGYFMLAAFFGMVGALSNSATEGPQLAGDYHPRDDPVVRRAGVSLRSERGRPGHLQLVPGHCAAGDADADAADKRPGHGGRAQHRAVGRYVDGGLLACGTFLPCANPAGGPLAEAA